MILLKYCPFCMKRIRLDPDTTPDPTCTACHGTGYVNPTSDERQHYFSTAFVPPES